MSSTSSDTFTVYVDTWYGSTQISSWTWATATGNIPASFMPTMGDPTLTRVDGVVPSEWNEYIQGKSKVTLTANNALSVYGATIKSYTFNGGGYSFTQPSNIFTTGFLNISGTNNFTVTATDTRNRSVTKTFTDYAGLSIDVTPYSLPVLTSTLSQRCKSDGTVSDDVESTYFLTTLTNTYSSCNNKNNVIMSARYKKSNDDYWSDYVSVNSGDICGGGNIEIDSSYDIEYSISDQFGSNSIRDYVSSIKYWMHCKTGGTGASFGKAASIDNLLDSAWGINSDVGFTISGVDIFQTLTTSVGDMSSLINILYSNNHVVKRGNVAEVLLEFTTIGAITSQTVWGIIPVGYRPVFPTATTIINSNGNPRFFSIGTNGNISSYSNISSGEGFVITFTYLCE